MTDICADIETSSIAYARRFAGPSGQWFLEVQRRGIETLLSGLAFSSVADVGGGHGQLLPFFFDRGCSTTIVGSAQVCDLQLQEFLKRGGCQFVVSPLHQLPFEAASFDLVSSIRLLAHFPEWQDLIRELCRISRRYVLVDFPQRASVNFLSPLLFPVKRRIEGDTRPYQLFLRSEVVKAFAANGFRPLAHYGQFLLPMALHRKLNRPRLSRFIETVGTSLGLTSFLGSPVLSLFEREATQEASD